MAAPVLIRKCRQESQGCDDEVGNRSHLIELVRKYSGEPAQYVHEGFTQYHQAKRDQWILWDEA